jgi:hypothetical protein
MECLKPGDIYEALEHIVDAPAADRTFEGPEVPEGKVLEIRTFWVSDESTANKVITLGFKRGNVIHILKSEAVGSSTYGAYLATLLILVEGEQPYAKITSASSGDELNFVVRGVYL